MSREKATGDTLYETEAGVMAQIDAIDAELLVCEYFALCTNTATTAIENPILGSVPTCARCAAKVEALA